MARSRKWTSGAPHASGPGRPGQDAPGLPSQSHPGWTGTCGWARHLSGPIIRLTVPATWRNWWDFGTGLLGDLGCHKLSTVFKALKLGHPLSVEASCTKLDPEIYPLGVIARFEFPAGEISHP